VQEGYAVSDFNFIKKGPADHQRSAGISDRKMSRIVTARKVGMMTAQGVNNRNRICVTDINNVTEYSGRKKIDQCKIFVPAASDINDFGYLKANMICEATAYAVEQGVQKESSSKDGKIIRYCNWWLRDTNCESKALVVSFSGGITEEDVDTKHVGIRPAMWIKVE